MALVSFVSAKFCTLITKCQLTRKILLLHIATRTGLTSKSTQSPHSTPNHIVQNITTLAISKFYCYNILHMVASSRGLGHMVFIHAIAGSNPAATTRNKKKTFRSYFCFVLSGLGLSIPPRLPETKRTRRVRFIFLAAARGCEPAGLALSRKRTKKKNLFFFF